VFIDLLRLGKVIVPLPVSTDYCYKVVVVPFADFRCIGPSYMPVPQTTLVHSVRFYRSPRIGGIIARFSCFMMISYYFL
jgi:hypothetical protein